MFAHQVIEDLTSKNLWLTDNVKQKIIDSIFQCQYFHIGNAENILDMTKNLEGKPLFENKEDWNMPYNWTWFDYLLDGGGKAAIMICWNKLESIIETTYFVYTAEWQSWTLIPAGNYIFLNQNKAVVFKFDDYIGSVKSDKSLTMFLSLLHSSLLLLSCKNIEIKKNESPDKLNKKRMKKNKLPLFAYHILYLKPTTKQEKSIPKHLWQNRIHLCRGHFKMYTKNHPLFGKFTGRYWWQAQARGNKKLGIVAKSYELDSKKFIGNSAT